MPPEASSNVDYATGTTPAADVRTDVWTLSPAEAGEILQQAAVEYHQQQVPLAPATPHEADVLLQQRINDPEWARKLMNGDIATRDEFQRLSELKAAGGAADAMVDETAIIQTTTSDTGLTRNQLIGIAEDMRAEGVFNDAGIEHILSDRKFPTQDVRVAQYYLGLMERDETVLYPDLPGDRVCQMKFLRAIAAIGDGSAP
jgi:hypothetical protein